MNDLATLLDTIWPPPLTPGGDDQRRQARIPALLQGRLAYGGVQPGIVGCDILDLSTTGARVETFAPLDALPEFLTLECGGMYNRVRACWTQERQIGLEFAADDMPLPAKNM